MAMEVLSHDEELVKARAVFNRRRAWAYGQDRASGRPFFIIPASDPDHGAWWTDVNDCTCPDRTYRRHACKHMLAVRLWCAGLLDGTIDSAVVTASDRRELFAQMAMRYDLDQAEQADSLLEEYERKQAAEAEAQDASWLDDWPEDVDDGRPVWLTPEDRYEPDTTRGAVPILDSHLRVQNRNRSWMSTAERLEAVLEALPAWLADLYPLDEE